MIAGRLQTLKKKQRTWIMIAILSEVKLKGKLNKYIMRQSSKRQTVEEKNNFKREASL